MTPLPPPAPDLVLAPRDRTIPLPSQMCGFRQRVGGPDPGSDRDEPDRVETHDLLDHPELPGLRRSRSQAGQDEAEARARARTVSHDCG